MRILIIHNKYQQKGGEDTVVEEESKLMSETAQVQTLIFHNAPGWKGALQFFFSIWNLNAAGKIKKTIGAFNPDLIHLHNWHYAIGPIVVRTAHAKKIPVVLTAHNFRLLCPSAILLHNGSLFLDSIYASFPWKAVRKKVYRNSMMQTFWLAFVNWFHKKIGTWKMIDGVIVQTAFAKNVFVSSTLGVAESNIVVKPNFVEDGGARTSERKDFFLFVGRLSEEKGINVLLDAFKNSKRKLVIAGEGPLKQKVLDAGSNNKNISYAGLLSRGEVQQMIAQCNILIFPSIWYEGMPMTIIEAFETATPVIAGNIGAMSSMIRDGFNGLHFSPGDANDLAKKVDFWANLPDEAKKQFSKNARSSYLDNYTPEKDKEQLLSIYQSAISTRRS